jgi:polyhydroxyalkanoate synthesis regulator phasin
VHVEKDNAVRDAITAQQSEIAQLRQTVDSLREALELAQIDKKNAVHREHRLSSDETAQLHATIQALREQLENH